MSVYDDLLRLVRPEPRHVVVHPDDAAVIAAVPLVADGWVHAQTSVAVERGRAIMFSAETVVPGCPRCPDRPGLG